MGWGGGNGPRRPGAAREDWMVSGILLKGRSQGPWKVRGNRIVPGGVQPLRNAPRPRMLEISHFRGIAGQCVSAALPVEGSSRMSLRESGAPNQFGYSHGAIVCNTDSLVELCRTMFCFELLRGLGAEAWAEASRACPSGSSHGFLSRGLFGSSSPQYVESTKF